MKTQIRSILTSTFKAFKGATGYTPPETVFKHLHFVGPFDMPLPNGEKIRLYSWGNRVENELAWRGWDGHEPVERRRWISMVAAGGDILDIGANTATFAFTAKGMSPESRVFAFEPVKRIAEKARQNATVSGLDVEIISSAFARRNGELPIYDPGGENAYSASLDADFLAGEKNSYLVPVVSLDEFCRANDVDPTAIKLDVEGYEGEVLCGASEVLGRGKCVFICEWLGNSDSHVEAEALLREQGYVALDVDDLSEVDLLDTKGYEDRNVILIHRDRVADIARSWHPEQSIRAEISKNGWGGSSQKEFIILFLLNKFLKFEHFVPRFVPRLTFRNET